MDKKKKWKIGAFGALGLLILLYASSPRYIQRALIHLYPGIDDLNIFASRPIKATDPQPWTIAAEAPANRIPDEYIHDFEKYQTIAYVVVKDNEIAFEQYWDGYNDHSLSNTFSMSKSVVALLAGCALSDGYIRSLDQPVRDFIPEYPESKEFEPLTLRHLLTMSAGIDFDEAYASLFSKTTEIYYCTDLLASALTMEQVQKPGEVFNYQSGATLLLSIALGRAIGKPISDYFSERVWSSIGAENDAFWSLDRKNGLEKAYCCIYSNARDYARLGQLLNNRGTWNGRQIVPEDYIEAMTTPDSSLTQWFDGQPNKVYGYQLWLTEFRGYKIQAYRGILGQYILSVPELNAVIVRLGKKYDETYTPDHFHTDILIWLGAGFDMLEITPKTGNATVSLQ